MDEHRNENLSIWGEQSPEVTKLYGDRYRMEFRCHGFSKSSWYYENRDSIFADFGTLSDAEMTLDGVGGSEAIPESVYPNMRLIRNRLEYTPSGVLVVYFLYETLTGTFAQEAADKVDYELNGLRRVTRPLIAKDGTIYGKTVGTSTIEHNEHGYGTETLHLASAVEDAKGADEDGYVRIVETWLESGTISQRSDNVGSQQAITIQAIGEVPATPTGYVLASTNVGNFEGYQTNDYTFLEPSILSQSEDFVGSQLAITIEAFSEVPSTPAGYSLARTDVSDFEGIKTNRYTYLNPCVLSRNISTRNNGALIIETVEAFNEIPTADTTGAVQIGNDISNVEGIPTRRYTFAKGDGQIRVSTRPASPALAGATEVTVTSFGTAVTPTGVLIAESESEEDGYIVYTKTALQGTITGTKQTYLDVVDVEVPGTVNCTTVAVSSGGVSGTLAVPLVTPRRNKKVAATVTVEITTTPPNTASLAFDLGSISCSVTTTNVSLSQGPGSTVTVGTTAVVSDTGYVQNFGASANIGVYPGCYLTNGSSNGTVSYITSSQPVANGNIITRQDSSSDRSTSCTGTGSSAATGYVETGIIARKSRPILTTLDGTSYYEVVTWSV